MSDKETNPLSTWQKIIEFLAADDLLWGHLGITTEVPFRKEPGYVLILDGYLNVSKDADGKPYLQSRFLRKDFPIERPPQGLSKFFGDLILPVIDPDGEEGIHLIIDVNRCKNMEERRSRQYVYHIIIVIQYLNEAMYRISKEGLSYDADSTDSCHSTVYWLD